MTDKEKLDKITAMLNKLSLAIVTRKQMDELIEHESIREIKEAIWELYIFASDVSDILDEQEVGENEPRQRTER